MALIGDGGWLMTAMEVLTAVELCLPQSLLGFCDARPVLIDRQQIERCPVRSAAGPTVRSIVGSLVSRLRGRGGNA